MSPSTASSPHTLAPAGDAIAVVGMACRFPGGADSPEALWRLLLAGENAAVEVPDDRWDAAAWYDADRAAPGKTDIRRAGFLREPITHFDAAFFGIAPREAEAMDPQQRLVLEVAWEALERAGLAPARLAGSAGGVFLGLYNGNYTLTGRGSPAPEAIGGWSASGGHTSIAAGRLSFTLGLHGPSLVVDTACSSSLVALHLAVRALRGGECSFALAGGCHLLLAPEALVASTKLGATAADGRCKPFDAAADGFGHGEGCGVVVLKRLADAQAAGDPILAVVRGSCVNQDGRSHSLTAPNGAAQQALVEQALRDAGVAAADVGYVEAHGTGTPLGDPIEVEALVQALQPTPQRPLRLGSVKANLGHLEAAAGIAGFIKAVLCLQHGRIPAQPGFAQLNPEIEDGDCIAIARATEDWPAATRIAGVSAFGFGGTNAHVVLQQAPGVAADMVAAGPATGMESAAMPAGGTWPGPGPVVASVPPSSTDHVAVLPLSARSRPALAALAARWAEALRSGAIAWADAVTTAATARSTFGLRVAVAAADAATAAQALEAIAAEGAAQAQEVARPPRIGFLFTGQGAQYAGMARQAYATQPAFRAALDDLAPALDQALGRPALPLLFGGDSLDATALAQPLVLAVELALARWLAAQGVQPAAVMGHSLGEYAAAVAAGALTAEEAIACVAERGRIMQALPAGGGMLAVLAPLDALQPELQRQAGRLDVAALNGPRHTVVAGPLQALQDAQQAWEAQGLPVLPLAVSHAFHSHLLQPCLPQLQALAGSLPVRDATLPLVSNLSGTPLARRDAAYWVAHARQPVRFAEGVAALAGLGCDLLVEVGPHAVLASMAAAAQPGLAVLPTLRRGQPDALALAGALAGLWSRGAPIAWQHLPGRRVAAPTYAFQRERHWLEIPARGVASAADAQRAGTASAVATGPGSAMPATGQQGGTAPQALPAGSETVRATSAVVYDFYDELTVVADGRGSGEEAVESHLTFGFLPAPVPGFSWVRALFEKGEDPAAWRVLRDSQQALKDALFDGVDFRRIRRVMDYGCGHAADLCALAQAHPHLQAQGYTLSQRQVDVGRARAARLGLGGRVRLDRADSSRVPFPGRFDLVFGFEVTGLVEDKPALFDNIEAHLEPGGLLVIADFVAPGESIANPQTNSFTPNVAEWVELFSRRHLRLVRAVDASADVADWLVDPAFESNVEALVQRFGLSALTRRHLLSNQNIGLALRKDLMRYLLLTAVHAPHEAEASLRAANQAALGAAVRWRDLAAQRSPQAWTRWIARLAWQPRPLPETPPPTAIAATLAPLVAREREALDRLQPAAEAVDALALEWTAAAFAALGCGRIEEAAAVPVAPRHERLRARLVDMLRAAGVERLPTAGAPEEPGARAQALAAAHPGVAAELRLLARCAPHLAEVLAGRTDPLDLLFPGGDASAAQALYQDSPFSAAVQRIAAAAVRALAGDAPLDVLEIGGGTGATTQALLGALPEGSSYAFTDLGASLVQRARTQLAGRGLAFATLDIARPPSAQGFAAGAFDLVVAANVLHATPDLAQALAHAAELLRPGGTLLLVENTGPLNWGELTFGLTEGMWAFADTSLRSHALVGQATWQRLLQAQGFDDIAFLTPGEPDRGALSRQCVMLARLAPRRLLQVCGGGNGEAAALAQALAARGCAAEAGTALPAAPQDILPQATDLVVLAPATTDELPAAALQAGRQVLQVVQALAALPRPPRLAVVAQDAQGGGLAQAPLAGLLRAVGGELPELRPRLLDVQGGIASQARALAWELAGGLAAEVRLGEGGRRVPALQAVVPVPRQPLRFDPQASWLVTGALGGVGRFLVDWMVAGGARKLVLAGRSQPDAQAQAWLQRLRQQGVACELRACDIGADGVAADLVAAAGALGPLRGVLHAAGVVADAALAALDAEGLAATFRAKVRGAWALHRATQGLALEHFVLFSSAAALLAPAGQANHAAANAFLDALARVRRAAGLPALSIGWGAWAEAGAAVREGISERVQRSGLALMPPAEALAALGWAMAGSDAHLLVAAADWPAYAARHATGQVPGWLRPLAGLALREPAPAGVGGRDAAAAGSAAIPAAAHLVSTAPAAGASPAPATAADLRAELAALPPLRRLDALRSALRAMAAGIMRLPPESLAGDGVALRDQGLDSLMSIELRNLVAARLGTRLPATLLFEHPAIASLADALAAQVLADLFAPAVAPASKPSLADGELQDLDAAALDALLAEELRGTGDRA